MRKSIAYGMLVLVTIIWGGGFIATSTALDTFPPFMIMMIRFLGASILPLILSWKALRKCSREQVKSGIITGIFLFLAFAFQTFGLKYSTPSKNAFLTATNVVFVPYLLWMFMHRKPKKKELIASLSCVCGIALLTLKSDALYLTTGDVLSLICALFFAAHIISLERYSSHIDVFAMTALQMLTAGAISAFFALTLETWPLVITVDAVGSLAFLIFGSTMLAYLLQTWAQKYTTANSASLILSMEALWASVFSFLFFQETLSPQMMLGAVLIFGSILYIEYHPKRKNETI